MRRLPGRTLLILLILAVLLIAFHPFLLTRYGDLLVRAEAPIKSDAILVLAGDFSGSRIRHACRLLRDGWAPYALVSGPMPLYGVNEADLAIAMMRREGFDDVQLEPMKIQASSTRAESEQMANSIRSRGIRKLMIVTSDYHTARAGRIFRHALPEIEIHMVAAKDAHFPRESWWREREGLKAVFYESVKTISSAVESFK
ncbi:MAG TPA: YdcF family protein [Bryobacteraceae bacterium]|nr:YdcF family protein [Bryobacteraceae bacterium]